MKEKRHSALSRSETRDKKMKKYQTPRLVRYGNLEELTTSVVGEATDGLATQPGGAGS
jgi:hypothetical protein